VTIRSSAVSEVEKLEKNLGASFEIKIKESLPADAYEDAELANGMEYKRYVGPVIDDDTIMTLLGTEGISDFATPAEYELLYTGLELVPGFYDYAYNYENDLPPEERDEHSLENMDHDTVWGRSTDVYFISDSETHDFFDIGALELVEGEHIRLDDKNVALVSDEIAGRNGLDIGDTVTVEERETLVQVGGDPFKTIGDPAELVIKGIFHVNFSDEASDYTSESHIAENFIFSDNETNKHFDKNYNEWAGRPYDPDASRYPEVRFTVDSPMVLDRVMLDVRGSGIIDWDYYDIYKDDGEYKVMAQPLNAMINISTLAAVIFLGGTMIVLYLILSMWVKGRLKEFGVLLSIGIGKSEIIGQAVVELLYILAAAFLIAVAISAPLSGRIGAYMADNAVDGCARGRPNVPKNALHGTGG
jgi:hypothetical protein